MNNEPKVLNEYTIKTKKNKFTKIDEMEIN